MAEPWAEPELATPDYPDGVAADAPRGAGRGAPLGLTLTRIAEAERIAEGVVSHAVGRGPGRRKVSDEPPLTGVSPRWWRRCCCCITTSVVEALLIGDLEPVAPGAREGTVVDGDVHHGARVVALDQDGVVAQVGVVQAKGGIDEGEPVERTRGIEHGDVVLEAAADGVVARSRAPVQAAEAHGILVVSRGIAVRPAYGGVGEIEVGHRVAEDGVVGEVVQ